MPLFSADTFYIRIRPTLLSIKSVTRNLVYEDTPQVAVRQGRGGVEVVAIGKQADAAYRQDAASVHLLNAFDHPRTIIHDTDAAVITLQEFLKRMTPKSLFSQPPALIFHPLEKVEGGLTRVESGALQEIGHRLKAKRIYIWAGRELSDSELEDMSFAAAGGE